MIQTARDRWFLLVVVLVFIIAKLPFLHYPFFWDESWSYEPGLKLMYQHGPSLLPNAIDVQYSRGHPLLFYASAAAWMRLFGDSNTAQHSYALCIAVLCLITTYEVCLRLFNRRTAEIGLLLVATQVIFFVQSTMLLPEVLIAWLSLLTLYCYASGRYMGTLLACTALMLSKESGMVMGLTLGIHAFAKLFDRGVAIQQRLRNIASVGVPVIVIVLFFVLQKKLNGWYLFPEHTGLMDWSWNIFIGKVRFCAEVIFYHQQRNIIYILLLAASAAAAIRSRDVRLAFPLVIGLLMYIYIGSYMGYISRKLFTPAIFAGLIYTFYLLSRADNTATKKQRTFLLITSCFLVVYHIFSSFNFLSGRYLLTSVTIFLVLAAYCFELFLRRFKPVLFYTLLAAIGITAGISFSRDSSTGDTELAAYPAMLVQEELVSYLEQHNLYDHVVLTHCFLEYVHLTNANTGFLHTPRTFSNVTRELDTTTEYIVFANIENKDDTVKFKNDAFAPVFYVKKGSSWGTILKRKGTQ